VSVTLQKELLNRPQYVSNRYRLSEYENRRVQIVPDVQSWDTELHNDVSTMPERKKDVNKEKINNGMKER
jgi:hypothetical protein